MKCIAIDAIHMLKTKSGFQYILTVIDCFTRYTVLYAIKDLTAQTAAKTMMNHMYDIYGVPDKCYQIIQHNMMQSSKKC